MKGGPPPGGGIGKPRPMNGGGIIGIPGMIIGAVALADVAN
eukprot:CAMPEP_0184496214 /NCGR_PEP_ID=MMETSP0113_2-20130426/33371_1 /TAXON_ID=91329 /ORGANISM="Norrisiella sphaerica, Strain BC52" /LENGTH=40 /DNA_ID= /DNA_START= /DNA_END= /DNA_ORIENTATION=